MDLKKRMKGIMLNEDKELNLSLFFISNKAHTMKISVVII